MWKVVTASVSELEEQLNLLEIAGFTIVNVLPVGAPEIASNVPRLHKSLEERTTFAVVAHKETAGQD